LPLSAAADRTEPTGFNHLPLDGETPFFAKPAQALDNPIVPDLLGRATIIADHELTLMQVLSIAARDKRVRGFYLVDQLVGEQKIESAVDDWRAKLLAPALELREQRIGSCWLVGLQDQLENAPPDRRQPSASEGADPLRACEGDFHLLGRHAQLAANEKSDIETL